MSDTFKLLALTPGTVCRELSQSAFTQISKVLLTVLVLVSIGNILSVESVGSVGVGSVSLLVSVNIRNQLNIQ